MRLWYGFHSEPKFIEKRINILYNIYRNISQTFVILEFCNLPLDYRENNAHAF